MMAKLLLIDLDNGIPNKPILVEHEGQGWYYGPTKDGQGAYMKRRWITLDEWFELNESATSSQAADSIIKTF